MSTHMPSDAAIGAAERAAVAPLTVPCDGCTHPIEAVVVDAEPGEWVLHDPTEPGAIKCTGCGETFCRDCAREHPEAKACAAERDAEHAPLGWRGNGFSRGLR